MHTFTTYSRELFVPAEMAVESPGVDFHKVDFGPAR